MKLRDFAKIYFVILLAHLAVLDVNESQALIWFTKPMLLFSLIAYFVLITKNRSKNEKYVLTALVFSLIGDVLLMFSSVNDFGLFTAGIGAFLFAQLFFTFGFVVEMKGKEWFLKRNFWLILPVGVYVYWFIKTLMPYLGDFVTPVIIYAVVLIAMFFAALNRSGGVSQKSFYLVYVGAIFFVTSDCILAFAKFKGSFPYSSVLVMATYGIAQFLIVWGVLHKRLSTDQH